MENRFYFVFEYIATVTKSSTLWITFNTVYNDLHTFKKEYDSSMSKKYLNPDFTDNSAREEFLDFMKTNFPDVKLVKVLDLVKIGYIQYPYLGSIMIDTPKDSQVYKTLVEKYGNPYSNEKKNNKALWVMDYEEAVELKTSNDRFFENI